MACEHGKGVRADDRFNHSATHADGRDRRPHGAGPGTATAGHEAERAARDRG